MSSLYSRPSYSPYSKGNAQDNEQLPLRSKAFSQIDNTIQNYSQSQYTNNSANQDKISEIKKKYEKLLSKSSNKSNQQNATATISTHQFGKSVSNFDANDENSRWNIYNKSYQTPTTTKDRRNADPYEGIQSKNINPRPYGQRQYYNPSKIQVKSQLQSNRVTLSAMKNELQSKLSDLTAKTNGSSIIRNPISQPRESEKKEQMDSTSYEAILSKYSKNISQNRGKSAHEVTDKSYSKYRDRTLDVPPIQKIETLETKIKETAVSSYIPKYTTSNKTNLTTIQRAEKDRQLSTISEISNSNHSQNPSYEIQVKDHKQKIYEKYRRIQNSVKQNAQSNLIIERPMTNVKKPESNNWFKNTTSYMDIKNQETAKPQQAQANMEFTLQRLDNSEGFSITRTVTQQNFMNLNKMNQVQARLQQRQRQYSAISAQGKSENSYKKTIATPIYNKCIQENTIIQSQKIIDEKSEIQKLKEKYNINPTTTTTKYVNPYREKRPDNSTKYVKDTTPMKDAKDIKADKQVKGEARNNEVISKEIEKLDMKIKQIQQNKKDLNINFRPYDVSKSVSKAPVQPQTHQVSSTNGHKFEQNQKIIEIAPSISIQSTSNNERNKYNLRYQAYLERVKPLYSQITLSESQKVEPSGFAIKLMPVQYNNDEDALTQRSASQVSSKSRINDYKNKVQLENRTDTGIEERKKRLQDRVEMSNNIKNLVKVFGQQAVLDEIYRNNKIWFASQRDLKWSELKKQLNILNINLSQSEQKNIFVLEESENNPFFSVSDNKCNMKTLVQSYKNAQRHWEEKIVHKFNRNDLQKQGLISSKIDCDKKGYIQVEDLVRFLNIQSGSFLRNRDVSIIFKRIANNGNKLQFQQFLNIISE